MGNVTVKPQITDEMVEAAARELCRFGTSFPTLEQTQEWVGAKWHRFKPEAKLSLTAALSVPCLQEPVGYASDYGLQRLDMAAHHYCISLNKTRDREFVHPLYAQPIEVREQAIREWQPIETAPRDGSEFQAWVVALDNAKNGCWEPKCRFNQMSEAFEIWGRVDYDIDGWEVYGVKPTYWMPSPTAPLALLEGR